MNNESGRSMVEMLGVLAIIGVLSVGGIAGYSMAMRKYRANEAINALAMAGTMCVTKAGSTDPTLTGLEKEGIIVSLACISTGATGKAGTSAIAEEASKIVGNAATLTVSGIDMTYHVVD